MSDTEKSLLKIEAESYKEFQKVLLAYDLEFEKNDERDGLYDDAQVMECRFEPDLDAYVNCMKTKRAEMIDAINILSSTP